MMNGTRDPHAHATGIGSQELADAGVHLVPAEAERERRLSSVNYNVVTYPILRLTGFGILGAIVVLHNTAVLGQEDLSPVLTYALVALAYCGLTWALLKAFYERSLQWAVDLGDVFFLLDLGLITYAIYASGGERSLLFFALAIRAGDQVHGGVLRTVIFAHAAALSYAVLVGWLYFGEGRALALPAEEAKILFIYASGLWLALSAWPAERIRERTGAAVNFASEVLARLEIRSRDLAEQTRQARILRRRADADARSRALAAARLGREFRGPLARIDSSLQGLQWKEADREAVADLRAATASIAVLTRRFDEIAERGRSGPSLGSVPLGPLLDQVVSQLRWWIEDREITCKVRVAESEPGGLRAHADEEWLEEALWNVAWLVVRGAARNATVEIAAGSRAGRVQVTVVDPTVRPSALTRSQISRLGRGGAIATRTDEDPPAIAFHEPHPSPEGGELQAASELLESMGGHLTASAPGDRGLEITLVLDPAIV
jgi:signal transduction histidine kinase